MKSQPNDIILITDNALSKNIIWLWYNILSKDIIFEVGNGSRHTLLEYLRCWIHRPARDNYILNLRNFKIDLTF